MGSEGKKKKFKPFTSQSAILPEDYSQNDAQNAEMRNISCTLKLCLYERFPSCFSGQKSVKSNLNVCYKPKLVFLWHQVEAAKTCLSVSTGKPLETPYPVMLSGLFSCSLSFFFISAVLVGLCTYFRFPVHS